MVGTGRDRLSTMNQLSAALRQGTRNEHRRAERTGFLREMIGSRISVDGYVLYLRNLREVYSEMEEHLQSDNRLQSKFALASLYRLPSIENDLGNLVGSRWRKSVPILRSTVAYCGRLRSIADTSTVGGLVAHMYVRYLGDLSGGQVLAGRLAHHLGLSNDELTFYTFREIECPERAKHSFRAALDDAGTLIENPSETVTEAILAFEHNIALSVETQDTLSSGVFRIADKISNQSGRTEH